MKMSGMVWGHVRVTPTSDTDVTLVYVSDTLACVGTGPVPSIRVEVSKKVRRVGISLVFKSKRLLLNRDSISLNLTENASKVVFFGRGPCIAKNPEKDQSDGQDRVFFNTNTFITQPPQRL